jgi:hypothetical protein
LNNDGKKDGHKDVNPNPRRHLWFVAIDEIKKGHGEKSLLLSVNRDIVGAMEKD